ncbi:MAG: sugar transferase, partial [Pseudomonadota bacterium]
AKRIFDVTASLILLTLTLPVIILFAILVKIDSKGPAFFRQTRVGLYGQPFNLIKLRSMGVDAEAGGAQFAQQNDPRVTRVGRVIRKLRIDELPQTWTVLKGEMSFVGPRPERPEFVADL